MEEKLKGTFLHGIPVSKNPHILKCFRNSTSISIWKIAFLRNILNCNKAMYSFKRVLYQLLTQWRYLSSQAE
jgi:hypothetical protein